MLKKSSCVLEVPEEFYAWQERGRLGKWWVNNIKYPVRVCRYRGRNQSLARIMYQKYNKIILDDRQRITHLCKNRMCLNINHLYVGRKKRYSKLCKNKKYVKPYVKLSLQKYREIRNIYKNEKISMRKLACKYGVSFSMICKIIHKKEHVKSFSEILNCK